MMKQSSRDPFIVLCLAIAAYIGLIYLMSVLK